MYDKYSLKKRKKTSDAISARQKISKEGKLHTGYTNTLKYVDLLPYQTTS